MEIQKERIMRFSKLIYVLLRIAFITLIVVGVLQTFTWLWSVLGLNTEVMSIAGIDVEAPLLFKLGNVKVYLPIIWESGFDFLGVRSFPIVGLSDLVLTVCTIIGLGFAMTVFKLLRENGSPFRNDVIKSLKKFSIALLVMGCVSGLVSFIAAGLVWVLCLIFDYGRLLQNENDTTL